MALRALMLKKNLSEKKAELENLRSKAAGYEVREAELEKAIEEAQTEEERTAVEESVTAHEKEKGENNAAISALDDEVRKLETELNEIEDAQTSKTEKIEEKQERKERKVMVTRFSLMSHEERSAFVEIAEVKDFLARARELSAQKRSVSGADLLIPIEVLGLIRKETELASKLLPFVRKVNVGGEARQNIMGAIPEGVWTEMCANLNELAVCFNQVEVDGYKVGGYVAVCNAALKDSDINLANELITAIGGAIAKALDKAILFGTGTKMPIGICTRLAQTSQPANWGSRAPAWTDLHTTNIKKLNIDGSSGTTFFADLMASCGIAKPVYNAEGLFWVMNRKTHLKLLAKALNFDNAGGLVAGMANAMPVIGGTIVEFEDEKIQDNEIIGGFGGNYLLAEREGAIFANSDIPLFLADQTVFKGTARYDGLPLAGEAFVVINFANTDAETSKAFEVDYANMDMQILTVTSAAGATTGKTVLTVSDKKSADDTLKYKAKATAVGIKVGDKVDSTWASLTSGTTEIAAAAGVTIAVVELDANGRVVGAGQVISVPKA